MSASTHPATAEPKAALPKAVKGMNDILPGPSAHWQWLEAKVRALMVNYDYHNIRTPIVEHTPVFVRGVGASTDIVEKEMYAFTDSLNGDALCLRPENTAAIARACLQHHLLYAGGQRLYYMGPMFRHERPQRGRYRQFHQIGAEALGFAGPEVDAEIILLAHQFLHSLGLNEVELQLNSLGQPFERTAHRAALVAYLQAHAAVLDEDAQRRMHSNPLRILDSKTPAMQDVIEAAPKLIDYLGAASLTHMQVLQDILAANGVSWTMNPRLVRGLDYYNLTVFEFVTTRLGSQGALCGGGRYDYLMQMLGGAATPAVGWSMGMERILELLAQHAGLPAMSAPQFYAIVPSAQHLAAQMAIIQSLRQQGHSVLMAARSAPGAMPSMKSQFKKADSSGAQWALIFGQAEWACGTVALKPLRAQGEQKSMNVAELLAFAAHLQPASAQARADAR